MVSANNRGGQANEGGSLNRAGIAAYLAVHGLFGESVSEAGFDRGGPYPTEIHLETADSVDDIKCVLSDGSKWFIQAKRACGDDAELKSTVTQWSGQPLGPGDRLGLAVRSPRGIVRRLGPGLDKMRRGSRLLVSETAAINAVTARFSSGVSDASKGEILRAAYVLTVEVEQERDTHAAAAARWMAGRLVPDADGAKAFDFLRKHFQHLAADAGKSDLNDWIAALQNAGLTIYPDAGGPPAARAVALSNAIAAYRRRLASRADTLSFSLFSDQIDPQETIGLLDNIVVEYATDANTSQQKSLKSVARRSARFILRGLPGLGKSVALEQLAAHWAADSESPLPIHVRLRRLSTEISTAADLTLRKLVSAGTDVGTSQDVVDGLVEGVNAGFAVLLLDGLDETFERRAVMVDALKRLTAELHRECGLILATRDMGLGATGRLQLPVATLKTPMRLEATLTQLLTHAAESRIQPLQRDAWLKKHTRWLHESMESLHPLWRIPLMATLMTIAVAQGDLRNVPATRAAVLCRGIEDSIERWETTRLRSSDWAPEMRPQMLLAAFAIASNMLADRGTVSVIEVQTGIVQCLKDEWGLAPALAKHVADQCLRVWDEHLGILIISDDRIIPRHRQLAEVGQAMWIRSQPAATQTAWLELILSRPHMRESAALAFQLSGDVRSLLMQIACDSTRPEHALALEWAVEWLSETTDSFETEKLHLIDAVANAAATHLPRIRLKMPASEVLDPPLLTEEEASYERDGPTWYWVRPLATLHLQQEEARVARMRHIGKMKLDAEQMKLASALALLTDHHDSSASELSPELIATVEAILDGVSLRAASQFRSPGAILAGYGDFAALVSRYLQSLSPESAGRLYGLAKWTRSIEAEADIGVRLGLLTIEDLKMQFQQFAASQSVRPDLLSWRCMITAISLLVPSRRTEVVPSQTAESGEKWRMTQLCRLLDATGLTKFSTSDHEGVVADGPVFLGGWLVAVGHACGVDIAEASAQASTLLADLREQAGERMSIVMTPPFAGARNMQADKLVPEDIQELVRALGSHSLAITLSTASLLVESRATGVDEQIRAALVSFIQDPDPSPQQ